MRPPEFTGGKKVVSLFDNVKVEYASMRPPEFTGGKTGRSVAGSAEAWGFNEAAGIHRRKELATGMNRDLPGRLQ